jgi:hypothetical protein
MYPATFVNRRNKVETAHNIRLTSAEIGNLWIQYMADSLAVCTLKYFQQKTEDTEIRPVLEYAQSLAQSHIRTIDELFKSEDIATPIGFTDKDVNVNAPRLFSDSFHLVYLKTMAKAGMLAYGLNLSLFSRKDVRSFARECYNTVADLDEQITQVLLSKGLYVRPPYITVPDRVEYAESEKFLGSLFGKQRMLSAPEVTHLFLNAQSDAVGKALLVGFSQVAHSPEIRQLFVKGSDIADKHVEIFGTSLKESGLPAPMSLDSDIMNTTISPFSDKLMLFHVNLFLGMGLGYYAIGTAASTRADLVVDYARLAAEIELYVREAQKMVIESRWMEEPPLADNRKALALSR